MELPFVLGVTGKRDVSPRGGVGNSESPADALRERVFAVLDWLFAPSEHALDPYSAKLLDQRALSRRIDAQWRGLGLGETAAGARDELPVVVLTALAPGADSIVAKAALDYRRDRRRPVFVRAILPFDVKLYRDATTFGGGPGKPDTREQKDFDRLIEAIREQRVFGDADRDRAAGGGEAKQETESAAANPDPEELWFQEERDLFWVRMTDELERVYDGESDPERDLREDCPKLGKPRRDLRYRAAGEYIATHSHLLLAVYDERAKPRGDPEDLFSPGTRTIVEVRRRGASFGILPGFDSFQAGHPGPVLALPLHGQPDPLLRLLHPYDWRPEARVETSRVDQLLRDLMLRLPRAERPAASSPPGPTSAAPDDPRDPTDLAWEREGGGLFQRLMGEQRDSLRMLLQAEELPEARRERLFGESGGLEGALRQKLLGALRPVSELYAAADEASRLVRDRRLRLLKMLAWLVGIAAILLQANESLPADPSQNRSAAGVLTLLVALGFVMVCFVSFRRYARRREEELRFDLRALAEALRTQFYWLLTGVRVPVADRYMKRHHGELGWIRHVLSAVWTNQASWLDRFDALSDEDRLACFEHARKEWGCAQRDWTRGKVRATAGKHEALGVWGWSLVIGGTLNVACLFFVEVSQALGRAPESLPLPVEVLLIVGLALLGVDLAITRFGQRSAYELRWRSKRGRIFRPWFIRPLRWGYGLLSGALVMILPRYLERSGWDPVGFPDVRGSWIIAIEAVLIVGALILSWSDRLLLSEEARSNESLAGVHAAAARRLEALIARCRDLPAGAERERAEHEIQALFYELGCEALAENAEWLILHRARPLEPFVAG